MGVPVPPLLGGKDVAEGPPPQGADAAAPFVMRDRGDRVLSHGGTTLLARCSVCGRPRFRCGNMTCRRDPPAARAAAAAGGPVPTERSPLVTPPPPTRRWRPSALARWLCCARDELEPGAPGFVSAQV